MTKNHRNFFIAVLILTNLMCKHRNANNGEILGHGNKTLVLVEGFNSKYFSQMAKKRKFFITIIIFTNLHKDPNTNTSKILGPRKNLAFFPLVNSRFSRRPQLIPLYPTGIFFGIFFAVILICINFMYNDLDANTSENLGQIKLITRFSKV